MTVNELYFALLGILILATVYCNISCKRNTQSH